MRSMHRCEKHGTYWFDGDTPCQICHMTEEEKNKAVLEMLERKTRRGRKWPPDIWTRPESE